MRPTVASSPAAAAATHTASDTATPSTSGLQGMAASRPPKAAQTQPLDALEKLAAKECTLKAEVAAKRSHLWKVAAAFKSQEAKIADLHGIIKDGPEAHVLGHQAIVMANQRLPQEEAKLPQLQATVEAAQAAFNQALEEWKACYVSEPVGTVNQPAHFRGRPSPGSRYHGKGKGKGKGRGR